MSRSRLYSGVPIITMALLGALPSTSALAADGQVSWRVELAGSPGHRFRQGIAADGTVYVADAGQLVAVSPQGKILWTAPGSAGGGPIVVGDDGTIYSAGGSTLQAHHPDGSLAWSYTSPTTQGVIGGPGIGPDGNIYVAFDTVPTGAGMVALDPAGNVLWTNPGSPAIHQNGGGGREIAFGADRLYAAFKAGQGLAPPALWSFELAGGNQLAYLSSGCDSNPAVNTDGRVIVAHGACGVTGYAQDGSVDWFTAAPAAPSNAMLNPVTGPDGSIYTAHNLWRFWSLDAAGNTRWYLDDTSNGIMGRLGVAPDNSMLLDLGVSDVGQPGWVRALSTADASVLWQILLPTEFDGRIIATSPPAFTADARFAYFAAAPLGGSRSFLYAIDLGQVQPVPGDVTGDGTVDVLDLLAVIGAWGPCAGCTCPEDVNGDCAVDVLDLLAVLASWG